MKMLTCTCSYVACRMRLLPRLQYHSNCDVSPASSLTPHGTPDQFAVFISGLPCVNVCLQSYATLRKEAAVSQGMPIAVRHLESIVRMSEAHAAMHLREYVSDDDVDLAIRCDSPHCIAACIYMKSLQPSGTGIEQGWL